MNTRMTEVHHDCMHVSVFEPLGCMALSMLLDAFCGFSFE